MSHIANYYSGSRVFCGESIVILPGYREARPDISKVQLHIYIVLEPEFVYKLSFSPDRPIYSIYLIKKTVQKTHALQQHTRFNYFLGPPPPISSYVRS